MSERFYEKFLNIFSGFLILLTLVLASSMLLLGYLSLNRIGLYFGYCVTLLFTGVYGIHYYLQFRNFKANLNLFIPSNNNNSNPELEQLNIEVQDLPLKVCLFYRNGLKFSLIQEKLNLKHPQNVKRQLIKGLDILLKSYDKHEGLKLECKSSKG